MKGQDFISIYPGVAAIIIGLLAVITTIIPPMTKKAKIIWIGVFALLAFTAIGASFWQQALMNGKEALQEKHDHERELIQSQRDHERDLRDIENGNKNQADAAYLKGQIAALLIITSNPPYSKRQVTALEQLAIGFKNFNPPQQNERPPLKKRATLLVTELFKFAFERDKGEPVRPASSLSDHEYYESYVKKVIEWDKETEQLYLTQFYYRVLAIHDELAENGQKSDEFDSACRPTGQSYIIKQVANIIGVMAEKLP